MLVDTPPPPIPNFYIFFLLFSTYFSLLPKIFQPLQKQFDPPPPNNLNLLENLAATFRNILTTQACNHLNQTTQTKYQPLSEKKNCQLFLKTFNPYRLQKQCEPLPKNRNPEKYLNYPE